jgi:hypothetical protein
MITIALGVYLLLETGSFTGFFGQYDESHEDHTYAIAFMLFKTLPTDSQPHFLLGN